jgi:hypothetical protein
VSIYSTHLAIDDDGHEPGKCAAWKRATKTEAFASGNAAHCFDGKHWVLSGKPCTCKDHAPYVYAGSHVNPSPTDPKGGYLLACAIPDYCHPDARFENNREVNSKPVNYLRLSVGEDPATYHGMEPGSATLILDRRQVKRLAKTLSRWLESHPRPTA